MRRWRWLLAKLQAVFRRNRFEQDLDREIASHLTLLADQFEREGMTPEHARQAARQSFGSVDQSKELARDARSVVWLEQTWQDARHACRSLRHAPGFALPAVVTLALGIGINATLFTAWDAVALKPLPVADPDRVVRLERWFQKGDVGDIQYAFSYPEFAYCRDHNGVLAGVAAASWPVPVVAEIRGGRSAAAATAETLHGELVSRGYFAVLGIRLRLGRAFAPQDDSDSLIVLSHSFWRRRFNNDPGVLDRIVILNGRPFTVAGVAPEEFTGTSVGLQVPDFWAPLSAQKELAAGGDWFHDPARMQLQLLARLKRSVSVKRAQAEVDGLIRQFSSTWQAPDRTTAVTLQHTSFLGNTKDPRLRLAVAGLMLIVGLVLLVACANIANMLFARAVYRRREIATRLALGASRLRVMRQLLTESLLLSLVAGGLGLLLSIWASKLLWILLQNMIRGTLTNGLTISFSLRPDIRIFAYVAAISVLSALLFGLSPALRSSRSDITTALKDEGSFLGSRLSRPRLRAMLVAGQVMVSTVLVITAGLLARGMMRSRSAGTGFETRRVLLLSTDLAVTPAIAAAREQRLIEGLRNVPEVTSIALGTVPLTSTWTPPMVLPGAREPRHERTLASYASAGYFHTLGIAMLRGRAFTRQEADRGAAVAVISELTARRFWPGEEPLGKRFQLDLQFTGNLTEFEVVGVAADVRSANLTRIDPDHVYLPAAAANTWPILVRVRGNIRAAETALRSAVARLDETLAPSLFLITLEDGPLRIHRALASMLAMVAAFLALLAMILAAVGIYGMMAFLVSQREREIGVRIAMGATPRAVLNAVLVQGLRPMLAGLAIGIAGAGALSWALHMSLIFPESSDLFYGLSFYDPATFLGASMLLASVALAASAYPARRALRTDPIVALRCQ